MSDDRELEDRIAGAVVELIEAGRLPKPDLDRIRDAVLASHPLRRGRVSSELAKRRVKERDEIAERKRTGQSIRQIAKEMDLTPSKVNRVCHDYNIRKGIGYVDR